MIDRNETPQPPATEPWEHKEIARLKAEVARLEGELETVYEVVKTEVSAIRIKVIQVFHKFGFNHDEAVSRTNEIVPEK